MVYVALLRGINVGGKSKVEMAKLKLTFERLGLKDVRTYINSGNIIFSDKSRSASELAAKIEAAIEKDFGFSVKVLIRDYKNIEVLTKALPKNWVNDKDMRCDVMFLWQKFDKPEILEKLSIKPEIEDVKYISGAIIWRVDRTNVTKSGLVRLVGSDLYKNMTIRNCNTVRKLQSLMSN